MKSKEFLYETVAKRIEALIMQQILKPGDRIPSVRTFSRDLQVSKMTVNEAYNVLMEKGWIEAKARSGYYMSAFVNRFLLPAQSISALQLPHPVQVTDMEAITLCLQAVTQPGDTVAIESPSYKVILQSLEALQLNVVEISTDPVTGIRLDELETVIASTNITVCVCMPDGHNPLGCLMPEENKKRLVEMLAVKQIPLIEDDCLGELYFSPIRPLPAKAFDKQGLVLYCSSFSKTIAAGLHIGWVSAGRYIRQVKRLKHMTNIATPGFLQEAIAIFMENGAYEKQLKRLRIFFQNQLSLYSSAILRYFPAATRISRPAGGCALWVELPPYVNAMELQQIAIAANLSIYPGNVFAASDQYNHYIRISCCPPWNANTEQGLQKLGELVSRFPVPVDSGSGRSGSGSSS
jgi:DNA-binding transcriptional MocR family regulator